MTQPISLILVSAGLDEWDMFTVPAMHQLKHSTKVEFELITVDNGGRDRGDINIPRMVSYAEAVNKAASAVSCERMLIMNNDIGVHGDWASIMGAMHQPYCGPQLLTKENITYVEGWCVLIDRDLWHLVGGFNQAFINSWEDVDLAWRLSRLGIEAQVTPCPFSHMFGATRARHPGSDDYFSINQQYLLDRVKGTKHSWEHTWQPSAPE